MLSSQAFLPSTHPPSHLHQKENVIYQAMFFYCFPLTERAEQGPLPGLPQNKFEQLQISHLKLVSYQSDLGSYVCISLLHLLCVVLSR